MKRIHLLFKSPVHSTRKVKKENTVEPSERKTGSWMRKISGGCVKKQTRQTPFQPVWHGPWVSCPPPHALASPPSGTPNNSQRKNIQVNNSSPRFAPLLRCPTWQQAKGTDSAHRWGLFGCASLQWRLQVQIRAQPLQQLIPTWSSLDHVFFWHFRCFQHPPPSICSVRGSVWCRCVISRRPFLHPAELHPMERVFLNVLFLFTC